MKPTIAIAVAMLVAGGARAYPLDAYEETGIARLEAYDLAREPLVERGDLKPGSLRNMDAVRLRLIDQPNSSLPARCRSQNSLSRRHTKYLSPILL